MVHLSQSLFFYFQIILHSLHRYQPRVHVIEARDVLRWGGGQHSFVFPETQFLTVTAYQNNKVPYYYICIIRKGLLILYKMTFNECSS